MSRLNFDLEITRVNEVLPVNVSPVKELDTAPSVPVVAKISGISPEIAAVISRYLELAHDKSSNGRDKLKFDQSSSLAVFFYEKARNVVDNKSDHLLRRNAIERIIRRLLWENPRITSETAAQALIRELIWSRYLGNNTITRLQMNRLVTAMEKYFLMLAKTGSGNFLNHGHDGRGRILALASAEIEEILDPEMSLVSLWGEVMESWFTKNYDWEDDISPEEKKFQILIAIHRSFLKSDYARIFYQMTKKTYPGWEVINPEEAADKVTEIIALINRIYSSGKSPVQAKLYRFMSQQIAQFQILKDVIESDPVGFVKKVGDNAELEKSVDNACRNRYREVDRKIVSGVIRSIIYILLTKIVFVLLIEVPYEVWSSGSVNSIALGLNLLLPPIFMLFLGLTIKKPGARNTREIIERIKDLVSEKPTVKIPFTVNEKKQSGLIYDIFKLVYILLFLLIFGAIVYGLRLLRFNVVNITVFFLFLSLVLLFGFRIQFNVMELNIAERPDGIFNRLLANLTLPFLNLGVWLSGGLSQLNQLTVLMDILIEMPLKTLVEIAGEWSNFIKEKRAEIVEVPVQ